MQFTLLQHGENINADHHITVTIDDYYWNNWYDEVIKRNHHNSIQRNKKLRFRTFDVDEAQECGVIGIEHLNECLNFLAQ